MFSHSNQGCPTCLWRWFRCGKARQQAAYYWLPTVQKSLVSVSNSIFFGADQPPDYSSSARYLQPIRLVLRYCLKLKPPQFYWYAASYQYSVACPNAVETSLFHVPPSWDYRNTRWLADCYWKIETVLRCYFPFHLACPNNRHCPLQTVLFAPFSLSVWVPLSRGQWVHCGRVRSFLQAVAMNLAVQRHRYKARVLQALAVFQTIDDSPFAPYPTVR